MNILALDTATEACSAALQLGDQVIARFEVAGRGHTQKLVPMVRGLLAEAGIAFAQLDAYVCGVGPGSFAGVRIGVSFVKGLALAHERRSEEHTSELQSLMRISYAVFCLKKKKIIIII